ncbi:MAG: hypothetical protein KAQ85_10775 [Thermodesulfovibrionia bacterium]|nr:hypothetical protein [Thermodesulfovibrionia bacterium]MCK5426264.1 hypothetical protein [Thermodesulfovibrionia bacterium]MCK5511552.1 hypothetical protein [Thermodesulfovibrionia bacterium]
MTAHELKRELETISPFIEKHTSIVCPSCEKVCCINKHGYYDKEDMVFLSSLGIKITPYILNRKDTDTCRFSRGNGCLLNRWMRPFRCTWYFCEPLLESMKREHGKTYRDFVTALQRMIAVRQALTDRL